MDILCRGLEPTADDLHDLRIAGKKARYVLEVVASCFTADQFSPLYRRVEQFQERLGAYNDDHELIALFDDAFTRSIRLAQRADLTHDRFIAALSLLRTRVAGRRDVRRTQFLRWWAGDEARAMIEGLAFQGPLNLPAIIVEPALGRPVAC